MPQVRINPWRHHQELLDVRAMFYPSSPELDERREAVEIVRSLFAVRSASSTTHPWRPGLTL